MEEKPRRSSGAYKGATPITKNGGWLGRTATEPPPNEDVE